MRNANRPSGPNKPTKEPSEAVTEPEERDEFEASARGDARQADALETARHAQWLAEGSEQRRYYELRLAAAPRFLGPLRKGARQAFGRVVVEEVAKDLTHESVVELTARFFPTRPPRTRSRRNINQTNPTNAASSAWSPVSTKRLPQLILRTREGRFLCWSSGMRGSAEVDIIGCMLRPSFESVGDLDAAGRGDPDLAHERRADGIAHLDAMRALRKLQDLERRRQATCPPVDHDLAPRLDVEHDSSGRGRRRS
jgi:protein required for attachment to host cells